MMASKKWFFMRKSAYVVDEVQKKRENGSKLGEEKTMNVGKRREILLTLCMAISYLTCFCVCNSFQEGVRLFF